ncbi:hypothetical protein JYU34_019363 [Plutella xylostella]|uniref:Major facilitator superfamily (MFS) profile domain-containing protein n=1 Tax=Plutella xylostella TaxID=51655 RepID=A0ABQ7PWW0_PLUXY|nr:hypothetical protein JYU34_019363 [Plutella xylostella]
MILFAFPKLIGFVILVFTNQYWLILCSRLACGLSDGAAFIAVNMYVSEIASKEIRGRLGIMMQISVTFGMVIMFCIGPFLDYYSLNALILCCMVVFTVPLFFIPESPYFLYRKGQRAESTRVLEKLHGSYELATAAVKDYESTLDREETMKFTKILQSKSVLKALVIGCLVNIGGQLSGANVVQSYMQTILELTQTSVSSNIASVILGIIQLFACVCTVFVIDRVGRKPIVTVCLSGVTLGLLGMGTFFRISDQTKESSAFINYLPLISMILVIFFNSAGIGSVIWPLIAELFNGRTRTFGMTCVQLSGLTFMFLSIRFFPAIAAEIGPSNLFYINSVMAVLLCLFVVFCVPETKGKSFVEIQQTLGQDKGVSEGVVQAA